MNVHNNIFHDLQKIETTKMSTTDEQINKMWDIHAIEYDSATKKPHIV